MKYLFTVLISIAVVIFLAAPAAADWAVGDDHKMHYPQLPDPYGWDVEISSVGPQHECADDWKCSSTGNVEDIHFWYSVSKDGGTQIDWVQATIYDDDRTGEFSKPGKELWTRTFGRADFTVVDPAGQGLQGFADPQQPVWNPDDHFTYQQMNIENIKEPFPQKEGTIYWLGLYVWWDEWPQEPVGWKTSKDHFEDAAVFRQLSGAWAPLDPALGTPGVPELLDFAFVITPEPGTLAMLLGAGLIGLVAGGRRRRKR